MKVLECRERIDDLKYVCKLYDKLYFDEKSVFYKCPSLKELTRKGRVEVIRLQELMYNGELEGDEDPNL